MHTNKQILQRIRQEIEPVFSASFFADDQVPLNAPTFGTDEVMEAIECLLSQNVTMGDKVKAFEAQFAEYLGVRHAVMVNSGSSANLLVLAAATNPAWSSPLRLQAGDEVLVPAVTWSTTLWPVINMGCVPVLVDADPKTLSMCPKAAARAITPRTRAIFLAHILGNACDMQAYKDLAANHNLLLLEDSCESLGTKFRGLPTGRFGLAATFSFFFSHHITTIEGGMITTDDDEFAELLRCLRAHGWTRHMSNRKEIEARYPHIDPRFLFINVGYNLRATEIQAAFGLHQLPKLADFNVRRRQIAHQLLERLQSVRELDFIAPTADTEHTWFGFPVLMKPEFADRHAGFVAHLEKNGIETRPIIAGNLAVQPALQLFPHRLGGPLPGADRIQKTGVYWGSHPMMTQKQIDHIANQVLAYFK